MDEPRLRLLPYAIADGPSNMAADEVLLESAAEGTASLRFYGWFPATLSLGYFQPEALRLSDGRLAALPFVRRPSGGATLVHDHEVTYALALPAGAPWQPARALTDWLCRMHHIIADALALFGVASTPSPCLDESRFGGLLCFQKITPGDLLLEGHKIVGSAQRRLHGALLQHGSVLLAASDHAPGLPGVRELTGRPLEVGKVCYLIQQELVQDSGWRLVEGDWSERERHRVDELRRTKYTREGWNRKR